MLLTCICNLKIMMNPIKLEKNKRAKANKIFAFYQMAYGFIGSLYLIYIFIYSFSTLQIALISLLFFIFNLTVFITGFLLYKGYKAGFLLMFIVQIMQITSLYMSSIYVRFSCGISYFIEYKNYNFSTDINLTDFNSSFAWQIPPTSMKGINIFALVLLMYSIICLFNERLKEKHV